MKKLIFALLLLIVSGRSFSQLADKPNQVGVRFGGYTGFTYRHLNGQNNGFEILLLETYPGVMVSGLFEKNVPIDDNFAFFAGAGLFVMSYSERSYRYRLDGNDYLVKGYGPYAGIEAALGLDYNFSKVPLVIGLDIRPRFPYFWDAGLNVRYKF